jgi:hypothetical protein
MNQTWVAAVAAAAAVVAYTAPSASAALVPVGVEASQGAVVAPGPLPGRDDPLAAIAGPDGSFFSLGFGGLAVFDFGSLIAAGEISIFETTNSCVATASGCFRHLESVEVFVSDSYVAGSLDVSGFVSLGSINNADAEAGVTLYGTGFRYVALIDTTPIDGGSFDGFDIDAIAVTEVPLPMSGMMLLSGLFGAGVLMRRAQRQA